MNSLWRNFSFSCHSTEPAQKFNSKFLFERHERLSLQSTWNLKSNHLVATSNKNIFVSLNFYCFRFSSLHAASSLRFAHKLIQLRLIFCWEALGNVCPVDNVKDGIDISWTKVFVLQVVSVFPDINAEQWSKTGCGVQWILIGTLNDLEMPGFRVQCEPCPATSLHTNSCCFQLLFQVVQWLEVFDDGFLQSIRRRWLFWWKILPEDWVVDVATAVESKCILKPDDLWCFTFSDSFMELVCSCVVVCNISIVMLGVVKFHYLATDGWFECGIIVGQVRESYLSSDRCKWS